MKKVNDKKIKVVLIDSGINTSFSDMNEYVAHQFRYRLDNRGKVVKEDDDRVSHEHGTAIAMVIRDLCKDVEVISFNILNNKLVSDGRVLLKAIEDAIELNPDIIHLSLGTSKLRYRFKLMQLVKKAKVKEIIVVSALHNYGEKSYPSYDKNTIRVATSEELQDKESFYYSENVFYAPIILNGIKGQEFLENEIMNGTSMAAGYITGHISRIIKKYPQLRKESISEHIEALGIINKNSLEFKGGTNNGL